jgi:mannosyltransferase OCH1-like enzyme
VRREFPEYLEAYRRLAKGVERADFFRYMVVLRHGGVYADLDTECVRPLDALLRSGDTLVAGWDNEFPGPRAALEAG